MNLHLKTERRRETRKPRDGRILLFLADSPEPIRGILLDASTTGLRIGHRHISLRAGDSVRFRTERGEGAARVIWNRVVEGQVESGLWVLEWFR